MSKIRLFQIFGPRRSASSTVAYSWSVLPCTPFLSLTSHTLVQVMLLSFAQTTMVYRAVWR
jgi:hypothetical protein